MARNPTARKTLNRIVPGEVITEAIAEHLEHVVAHGGFVEGATDQALDRFRVVAGA
jgi:arginine/lysine/ornithine decarboxylase